MHLTDMLSLQNPLDVQARESNMISSTPFWSEWALDEYLEN